jgi:hypothetical protein
MILLVQFTKGYHFGEEKRTVIIFSLNFANSCPSFVLFSFPLFFFLFFIKQIRFHPDQMAGTSMTAYMPAAATWLP